MKIKIFLIVFMGIGLGTATIRAETIPGRWERVEALPPGTAVIVKLQGGERLEGIYQRIGPDEIVFVESNGIERRLPRMGILKIESATVVPDRLCNGALYGAFIGIAAGIGSMVAYGNAKTNGPVQWMDEDGPGYLIGSAIVGGGIGAAIGALLDASIKHHEVLFKARDAKLKYADNKVDEHGP
jgi:hypothetical protein